MDATPWSAGKCPYKVLQYMASGMPWIGTPVGDGNDGLSDCENHNAFTGGAGANTCQGNRTGSSSSSFNGCGTVVACPGA